MDIMKKNQEKISQKLIVMSNEFKKTESNFAELSNYIQKSNINNETTNDINFETNNESVPNRRISVQNNESVPNRRISIQDFDINSKNIKQILNILSSNFGYNFNDSEKMSDRVIKIEKSIDVLEKMTFQKLEKFDKQTDNIIHSINVINKYIREHRIELDTLKSLMKNNKDKLS